MIRYVGLDVHKRSVRAHCISAQGHRLWACDFGGTRRDWLEFAASKLKPDDCVALEATTHCWSIVELLEPHAARVAVSNPLKTKAIAEAKVKTDKIDAEVLAQLLRCDYLPCVWIPDAKTRALRTLTRRRCAVSRQGTAIKNRIHSVLAQALIDEPDRDLFCRRGRQWLKQALADLSEQDRELIESDVRLLDAIESELEPIEQRLAEQAYQDDRARLLMTLPGVDFITAQGLLAALGDISRFEDADHVTGYLGLCSSTIQSARRCFHGPITKRGNSHARWLLVQAAQSACRHPGPLGAFFARLARKKDRNVAIVALARKLAEIAYLMLKNNEPYRYAQPAATQNKLSRLRVRATGQKRKTGPKKGTAPSPHFGTGKRYRTTPSLAQVLESEGLPQARTWEQLPAGEQRVLTRAGSERYVRQLEQAVRVQRKPRKKACRQT